MIGNCNRTTFSHGAMLCQRYAVENLLYVPKATCESEYLKQTNCITKHVQSCLQGTSLSPFWAFVVDLINHVVMNCGSVSGVVNDYLLQELKCGGAKKAFDRTKDCWTDFADKVKANKTDPSLCSVYATTKHCVANITNKECPEVRMEEDHCNPFCDNRTDDHRQCPVTSITLVCETQFYFEKRKVCEKPFIDSMAQKGSCGVESPKFVSCVKDHYKACFNPRVDNALLDQLVDIMVSTSNAQRMFCDAARVNTSAVPSSLNAISTCNANFSSPANNCVKEFKEAYSKNTGAILCSMYENASSCLYKTQETHCKYPSTVLQILNNSYNPFICNTSTPTQVVISRSGGAQCVLRVWSILVGILFCKLCIPEY
ncbi:uncharacterized protein LOC110249144 isoform X2 [Exaiptasia diaphana]|nr:uncharacterized protein LOC110238303 isoform X2 [Exaiptasia diaphana]XP_020911381.1 uncharacterized protein LOC110249144 isoform X2 [Exaiptasia diaphana]